MVTTKKINSACLVIIGNEILSGRTQDLDNEYYENSLIAKKSGVQFRAFKCNVSYKGINITGEINIDEN